MIRIFESNLKVWNEQYSPFTINQKYLSVSLPQSIYKYLHICIHSSPCTSPAFQPIWLYASLCQKRTYKDQQVATANAAAAQIVLDAFSAEASLAAPTVASLTDKSKRCVFFKFCYYFFLWLISAAFTFHFASFCSLFAISFRELSICCLRPHLVLFLVFRY